MILATRKQKKLGEEIILIKPAKSPFGKQIKLNNRAKLKTIFLSKNVLLNLAIAFLRGTFYFDISSPINQTSF